MNTKPTRADVTVTFNGEDRTITFEPHEAVEAVLNQAMNAFGITDSRHMMSLFDGSGAELDDHRSMEDAGVKPGDVVVLRQSTVKGG